MQKSGGTYFARAHVQGDGSIPDLKNGWADCAQIWCTARDRLVGCRASQLEAHPYSFARAGINPSLVRLSPHKASYWLLIFYENWNLEIYIILQTLQPMPIG